MIRNAKEFVLCGRMWGPTLVGCKVIIHQHLDQTLTLMIAGHCVGHYSAEGALDAAHQKTNQGRRRCEEKSKNRLSLPTCKSCTRRATRTFPPARQLPTYESGYFTCWTLLLANASAELPTIRP